MTGIFATGVGVGTMIFPPVASHLISNYGWRTSYTAVGATALVLLVLVAQFVKRDPGQIGQLPYGESEIKHDGSVAEAEGFLFKEAISTRQFWMFFTAYVCFGYCIHTIMVHIVSHATDLGISAIVAANIMTAIGALSLAGRLVLGSTADRISNKLALIIGLIIMTVALVWLQFATDLWMLYLFAAILGFGYGGLAILHPPVVAELFGLRAHGAILGTISFGISIGGTIGPLVAGRIFDITGSYYTAFLVCAVLGVIGILLVTRLRSPRREDWTKKRSPQRQFG